MAKPSRLSALAVMAACSDDPIASCGVLISLVGHEAACDDHDVASVAASHVLESNNTMEQGRSVHVSIVCTAYLVFISLLYKSHCSILRTKNVS